MKHAPRLTALLLILALLTGLLPAASAASQPAEPRIAAEPSSSTTTPARPCMKRTRTPCASPPP